jgi:DNA-binding NarL/FixJ family response regulator
MNPTTQLTMSTANSQISTTGEHMIQNLRAKSISRWEGLTEREHEVLAALAQGSLYKQIAESLGISIDTVRKHVQRIYDKLHVRSKTEAAVKFLRK